MFRAAVVAFLALPAAIAGAQGGLSIAAAPNRPATGTKVAVTLDGTQLGETNGQTPKDLRLVVQRGFRFDRRAVRVLCTDPQACPEGARVARGEATIKGSLLGISRTVTARLGAFLSRPKVRGDLAGLVVVVTIPELDDMTVRTTGRVRRARGGLELRFDDITGGASVPSGVKLELQRLTLTAGARRTVRRAGRRVRYDLITTPSTCAGTWTGRGVVTFTDGSERTLEGGVPCVRSR